MTPHEKVTMRVNFSLNTSVGIANFASCTQPIPTSAGCYMFVEYKPDGGAFVHYISQATNLQERLTNHERIFEARQRGCSDILICAVADQTHRDTIERELIERHAPPMNAYSR